MTDRAGELKGLRLSAESEGRKNGSKTAACQTDSHRFVALQLNCPSSAVLKINLTDF